MRYWRISGGSMESCPGAPGKSEWYAKVKAAGNCLLKNYGYNGNDQYKDLGGMGICAGETYHFSAYLKSEGFTGMIRVYAEDDNGTALTDTAEVYCSESWQQASCSVKADRTAYGRLVIAFEGAGDIDIDCVCFEPDDVWGRDDPKWSVSHMRRDLVEALRELKPSMLRFPGGCIVGGTVEGNEYEWKKTVGPLIDREEKFNLWASGVRDKGYTQSNQIGFYEYFLLCEDLHMEPLPVVWAGIWCQARSKKSLRTDSQDFQERVVQNALDLIEFANGDPETSEWAKTRADMGHPAPFNMKMIGIGNENFGSDYLEKFAVVKAAIDEKYPGMSCILAAGGMPDDENLENAWKEARGKYDAHVFVDEHFYKNPDWVYSQMHRYDGYERGTAKVFLGEYAAHGTFKAVTENTWQTAIAEAAFLTGVERNSDVVGMCTYAPLFCLAECGQWTHNMIYFNPFHIEKSVNYYVQQMYSAHQGDYIREIEGRVPENLYLSAMDTDEKVILKIANTADTQQSLNIDIAAADGNAQVITLSGSDAEEANSLTFTGEPVYKIQPVQSETMVSGGTLRLTLAPQSFTVIEAGK